MNPFQSLPDYEHFIYTLPQRFPQLVSSTLIVIRRARHRAEVMGELYFPAEIRLVVYQHITCEQGPVIIEGYGYEVWRGNEKLYWYDSQPHPNDPVLASTNPHHKHVPPNMKHNRVPAPDLSFTQPNLPFLIGEIEKDLLSAQESEW